MSLPHHKKLIIVFLLALILRGIVFVFVASDPQVVLQPDSKMYVLLAQGVLQYGRFAYAGSPQKPNVERMPGYPFFLSEIWRIFGQGFMAVIWIQILIDSLSCVLICLIAEKFMEKAGWLAGVFAACNLSMITYAFFILNDCLFLLVFLAVILCLMRAIESDSWRPYALTGIGLGLAALIRPVIMYLPFFLAVFFVLHVRHRYKRTWSVAFFKALIIITGFFVVVLPWAVRNYIQEGRLKLTSQYGEQLLQYVVPFVWEYSRGTSFIDGLKKANREFEDSAQKMGYDLKTIRPFDKADLQTQMALKVLKAEPKSAIIKAWMAGMAKNLFAPALVDFSYLFNIERPHFFYTKGKNALDRIFNFLKGMQGIFSWFLFISLFWMAISRVLQLWGLSRLLRSKPWECGLVVLIIGYFLLISGPVGYAKYRLPFEPVLIVLLAIGIKDLFQRWIKRGFSQSESKN